MTVNRSLLEYDPLCLDFGRVVCHSMDIGEVAVLLYEIGAGEEPVAGKVHAAICVGGHLVAGVPTAMARRK